MAKKVTKKKAPAKKKTTRNPRATTKAKAAAKSTRATDITEEQIRARAFEIYRSGRNRDPDADWLQAEQELRTELTP